MLRVNDARIELLERHPHIEHAEDRPFLRVGVARCGRASRFVPYRIDEPEDAPPAIAFINARTVRRRERHERFPLIVAPVTRFRMEVDSGAFFLLICRENYF